MLSRLGLRWQLFGSYLVVLVTSLTVIGAALLILTSSQPAPPEQVYRELAIVMQNVNLQEITDTLAANRSRLPLLNLGELFDEFAAMNNVRVIVLVDGRQQDRTVLYDSHETLVGRQLTEVQNAGYASARLQQTLTGSARQMFGDFEDTDGSNWLFGGVERTITRPGLLGPGGEISATVLLAAEQPTVSLQSVLGEFSSSLLPVLIQAGLVGLIISFVLAFIISRGISQPLQAVVQAASAVARGEYHQRVPETGPQEVRTLAQSFNQMSGDVRAAQESQRDFLANVSHDLKTPLTSIQGYSQAIMDGAAKEPVEAARIIHDEANRLNRMVVQLTDLARMQAGRLSMHMDALDIGEMAAAIGQRLSVVARRKEIQLKVESSPLPHIAGDGDRLAQVLDNLLSNAIKFTPPGGKILLKTEVAKGGVQITVRDTGIGIPPRDLPRVFERFYQVDKARGPKRGTGLGLAITREIVQAHGGTIRVHSAGKNKGTTFTIWLPSPQLTTMISRRPPL